LHDIPRIVWELQGQRPNRGAGAATWTRRVCIGADGRVSSNKMPNNFLHIGLIHLMLPNARIIDIRREPIACCVSNLKQL
jgi:hypothetical protein